MHSSPQNIQRSLNFLRDAVTQRLQQHFNIAPLNTDSSSPATISTNDPLLDEFVSGQTLTTDEYIILLLALVPHVQPNFLDGLIHQYLPQGGDFAEMGGVRGTNHRSTIPTGETAQFIIAGNDLAKRLQVQNLLQPSGNLLKHHLVSIDFVREGEPYMSGRLVLSDEVLSKILFDKKFVQTFSPAFPAKLVQTKMEWSDLVLSSKTSQQIADIKMWLNHNDTLLKGWGMGRKIKPGYRALFFGPPGTGKTLTASLLGKEFNKDVYRIDLSQVVSKYIGETEKNLEKVFSKAENKNWILFFDEADALFGKRSNVQNAHDKYANQEVSYLLQRVEDFPGLIILASNYKTNIDTAFMRRFSAIIQFAMPTQAERCELWKSALPANAKYEAGIDLQFISSKYELSGAAILSVIHYAALAAIHAKSTTILKRDLIEGIKREYEKEERVFPG